MLVAVRTKKYLGFCRAMCFVIRQPTLHVSISVNTPLINGPAQVPSDGDVAADDLWPKS
jgi:hypothetical protein